MPRSSGTYTPPAGQPVVTGTTISSTVHNALVADLGNEITNSVPRDGTAPPTANLPMGNYKFTGLSAGTVAGDSLRYEQVVGQYLLLTGGTVSGVLNLNNLLNLAAGADIASASTVDLGTATGNAVTVTHASGTLAITSFGGASLQSGTELTITWSVSGGSLSVTHNATSLILPSAANLTIADGDVWKVQKISDSLAYWRVIDITKADGTSVVGGTDKIQPITASVAANALTITLNPTTLDFRDATLGSGTVNTRTISSPVSIVIPSGATLGTINGVQSRLAKIAIDNGDGTVQGGVVNLAGGVNLDEAGLISTTAIDTASDSANVIYSTSAVTNKPYRVVGFVESIQATAGTWATAPSTIQGVGGQALAALSSLGYGQTWQSVTRTAGVTYYNTTGKPIMLSLICILPNTGTLYIDITQNGSAIRAVEIVNNNTGAQQFDGLVIIPPGAAYVSAGNTATTRAFELR